MWCNRTDDLGVVSAGISALHNILCASEVLTQEISDRVQLAEIRSIFNALYPSELHIFIQFDFSAGPNLNAYLLHSFVRYYRANFSLTKPISEIAIGELRRPERFYQLRPLH